MGYGTLRLRGAGLPNVDPIQLFVQLACTPQCPVLDMGSGVTNAVMGNLSPAFCKAIAEREKLTYTHTVGYPRNISAAVCVDAGIIFVEAIQRQSICTENLLTGRPGISGICQVAFHSS